MGSVVSRKVLPQFEDTVELYHHCRKAYPNIIPFVLIPSLKMQQIALDYKIHHMSFISSVSESFQKKNTKMSLFETKKQLAFLIENCPGISKLYVSCVNECPISGIIDNKEIVKELGGDGGVVVLDRYGNVAMEFNTAGMYRAHMDAKGNLSVKIYKDE